MVLNILYHGLSCFEIEAKSASGSVISVVADPYNTKGTGFRLPRTLSGNILTISRDNDLHNNIEAVAKPELIITEPGEYEKGGVFVYGILSKVQTEGKEKANIIYRYEFEDITVAHLGDLSHVLTDEQFSALKNVDILLLPVGGGESLDYKKATEIANQIEPKIVIPMHYTMPSLAVNLDSVDKFLKEYGAKSEKINKLKIAKKDLLEEDTKVIVLEKA